MDFPGLFLLHDCHHFRHPPLCRFFPCKQTKRNICSTKKRNEGELSDLIRLYWLFWFWKMKSLLVAIVIICIRLIAETLHLIFITERMATVIILHKRLQRSKAKQLGSTGLTCLRYRWSLSPPCLQQSDRSRKHMFHMIYHWSKFGILHLIRHSAFAVRCSTFGKLPLLALTY